MSFYDRTELRKDILDIVLANEISNNGVKYNAEDFEMQFEVYICNKQQNRNTSFLDLLRWLRQQMEYLIQLTIRSCAY